MSVGTSLVVFSSVTSAKMQNRCFSVLHLWVREQQRALRTLMPTAAKHCHLVAVESITLLDEQVFVIFIHAIIIIFVFFFFFYLISVSLNGISLLTLRRIIQLLFHQKTANKTQTNARRRGLRGADCSRYIYTVH